MRADDGRSSVEQVDEPVGPPDEDRPPRWYEFGRSSNRVVRQAYRMIVLVVGASIVGLGLVLAVLPGPWTIPLVLLGLAILATEFMWARRLLHRAKGYAEKAKSKAKSMKKRKS